MAVKRNKRIVVTGAKGGTGVSIVKVFRQAGYEVLGIDIKPHEWGETNYKRIDLLDGSSVHDAFAGAHGVVHFGSYPWDGLASWDEVYQNIAVGGFHVLQACANLGIKRVAYASSPTIYGTPLIPPSVPVDESLALAPSSIYSAAKENLESLARNYCQWNPDMGIAALRTMYIVYEGAFNSRFKSYADDPAAAARLLWSYVDARDAATAALAWIDSDITGFEAFNVAAADVCSDIPARTLVNEYLPQSVKVKVGLKGHTSLVSCKKLRDMLGWKPKYTWHDMKRESREAYL